MFSDVVCPWCAIGKRHLEAALEQFEHRDEVEIIWRSFELDPRAPRRREGDLTEHLARKYGMDRSRARAAQARITSTAANAGLDFRLDHAQPGNTFDAHRLLHLARERDVQDALKERLLIAYVTEGEAIGDPDTLVRLAAEAGLDAEEARRVLEGNAYADEVRADEEEAMDLGVTGVPFFVFDRTFAVAGAQPVAQLLQVLERAWSKANPLIVVPGTADSDVSCDDGSSCII